MDKYTNNIQSVYIYLKELKYKMPKPFIAWFIFRGLNSSFDGFISRKYEELAKDLKNINLDKLFSELISEEARMKNSIDLEANKVSTNKSPFCKHCNKKGHLETKYFKKYPELKNKNKNQDKDKSSKSGEKPLSNKQVITAFSTLLANLTEKSKNKIILDSGASEYFSPNKN
jgi:hypothetical protein